MLPHGGQDIKEIWPWVIFQLTWTKSRKSYCTTPGVSIGVGIGVGVGVGGIGGGVGVSKMLKFLRKSFFNVIGKALSVTGLFIRMRVGSRRFFQIFIKLISLVILHFSVFCCV